MTPSAASTSRATVAMWRRSLWAVALHFMYYNFVRIHKTLWCSPAMAAGVTDRLWELKDIAALIDAAASKPGRRGPYKKKEG